jgi:tripartite-type tricarboxylate transporter receptor subunit TctC
MSIAGNLRDKALVAAMSVAFLYSGLAPAQQNYPSRPIRIITLSTSGGTDLLARVLGDGLSASLGQPVLVEPRPGASGEIAGLATARATPDGYTILLTFYGLVINAAARGADSPFDVVRDFTPITQIMASSSMITVNAASSPANLKEFVAWTKGYKGNLNVGVPGQGSGGYLAAEIYNGMTGTKAQLIPHNGSAPALRGVLGGEYQYAITSAESAMQFIRNGQLRSIAITGSKRVPSLPNVPVVSEELPGYNVEGWWGIVGPAKMPPAIVSRLHQELAREILKPEMRKRIAENGGEPVANTPEEFGRVIAADLDKYRKFLKPAAK